MPDGAAKTHRRSARPRRGKAEKVEQLCRLWRSLLAKRDALSEDAAGDGREANAARAILGRLDAALGDFADKQRGQQRLSRIVDRWCGEQRVEALRVTEDLLRVIVGEATGGTLRTKWARMMKRVKERGNEVVFRQLGEREVLASYKREVDEVLHVLGVTRKRLYAVLVRPDVESALYTAGVRTASLRLLQALGFGSVSTSYRKLAEYAHEHKDGVMELRVVPARMRSRASDGRRKPKMPSRKTHRS